MADITENDMLNGIPARLRGLDIDGNSISSTIQEVVAAMPIATTSQGGMMCDYHSRKLEGLIYTSIDKNKFVYKTNMNYNSDSYATFRLVILYASGIVEYADCFFILVNRGNAIYFMKSGSLLSTVKSFVLNDYIYFYFEFRQEYGRILIYPDFGLRFFELTEMTVIPGDAIFVVSMQ